MPLFKQTNNFEKYYRTRINNIFSKTKWW